MLASLPPLVLERYQACQTVCFCGVFPELKRAWATVDNSLFLWRFDRWCAALQGSACFVITVLCLTRVQEPTWKHPYCRMMGRTCDVFHMPSHTCNFVGAAII